MLTESEKLYMEEFLQGLPIHSVLSVSHTVSKGMLEPEDKAAAIKIIVQHSDDSESILTRKFISKQYLFSYLHWRNVSVSQSSNKNALIKKILALWAGTPFQNRPTPMPQNYQTPSNCNGDSPNSFQGQNPEPFKFINPESDPVSNASPSTTENTCDHWQRNEGGSQSSISENSCNSTSSYLSAPNSYMNSFSLQSIENNSVPLTYDQNSSSNVNPIYHANVTPNYSDFSTLTSNFNVNELAMKFAEWYFSLVNKTEYITTNPSESYLGPQHFWQDATIKISLTSNNEMSSHEATGGSEVTELILNIKTQHSLFFNPNLSYEGVRGKSEPHGMAVIVACGTLHKGVGQFVGVFEQIFYLLRDPLCSNNWKVKHSQLILRSKTMNSLDPPPTLHDSELAYNAQLQITN